MKMALQGLGALAVGLSLLLVAVVAIGSCLPVKHRSTRESYFPVPAAALWAILTDFAGAPGWRPEVARVERVEEGGETLWREWSARGEAILYRTLESEPPRRLVRQIADLGLPFAGRWTLELEPQGPGCRLRVTEDGEVYNPLYRFMSRFVFGHATTLERYLQALHRRIDRA